MYIINDPAQLLLQPPLWPATWTQPSASWGADAFPAESIWHVCGIQTGGIKRESTAIRPEPTKEVSCPLGPCIRLKTTKACGNVMFWGQKLQSAFVTNASQHLYPIMTSLASLIVRDFDFHTIMLQVNYEMNRSFFIQARPSSTQWLYNAAND